VEKYCIVGQATDDNMAHAHCMLDKQGYKHKLTICNNYCFSTEKYLEEASQCFVSVYGRLLNLFFPFHLEFHVFQCLCYSAKYVENISFR
jgi:hypothetical protein